MATIIEIVSVSEAAEILDCGVSTVHYLIQDGQVAAYRVTGKQKLYLQKLEVQRLKNEGWRKQKLRSTSQVKPD
jgi:excisionase family DNA binding protein